MSNFNKITLDHFESLSDESYMSEVDGHAVYFIEIGDDCVAIYYVGEGFGSFNREFTGSVLEFAEQDPHWPF